MLLGDCQGWLCQQPVSGWDLCLSWRHAPVGTTVCLPFALMRCGVHEMASRNTCPSASPWTVAIQCMDVPQRLTQDQGR